ncbi:NAD-dependent epimerase/dehydratase family protein [Micromonospora sp. DT31]|uniref:NAD-dependent epimerase/dehydratase family protein n=1 Tax=Micromonospora sp. DT31 TaxID=3393434 RepID=UPI003CEDA448
MVRTVLLFGSGGFLGRHIRRVLDPHYVVRCPDRQECDLVTLDLPALAALLGRERPDAVVLAAGRIVGSGYDFVQAHVTVTAKMIEAMAAAAPAARLVRIGSAAEYGPVARDVAVREGDPASPVGAYGVSHLAATRLAELAGASGRVDTVVLRVFNPVGPGMPPGNVLGRAAGLIRAAVERGDDHVALGLLDSWRDFVDVRDVAGAVLAAVRCGALPQRVFNVGSGRATATREAVRQLADIAGFPGEIRTGAFGADATRSAAVPWICADIGRGQRLLGWTPAHPLADSLTALWRETVERVPGLVRQPSGRTTDVRHT